MTKKDMKIEERLEWGKTKEQEDRRVRVLWGKRYDQSMLYARVKISQRNPLFYN